MGRKNHTTTAAAAPQTPGGSDLPELPVLGHQRQWDAAKLVLRAGSLVAAAAVAGFVVAFNFAGGRYVSANSLSVAGWDAAEFVVVCARRDRARGIRAAAHVGVDLVLWLAAVATLALQSIYVGYRAGGGYYTGSYYNQADYSGPWFAVDVTHLTLLGVLAILHFVLFVRACVEVDRHKKDRRVQELILAMQKQGRNPRDFPLATFTQQHLQTSASSILVAAAAAAAATTTPSASERDFSLKYGHALAPPVPGLLASSSSSAAAAAAARSVTDARLPADAEFPGEMPVSPEELRNEKVLIGAFPR
ncbi:hypothetical protein F4809DRAFT_640404 [Biscogniauxia mediterranea]|nr:hypothetical protein F4809DRAFT_640404 [Biscogniauxia mediterranea]